MYKIVKQTKKTVKRSFSNLENSTLQNFFFNSVCYETILVNKYMITALACK